jgi:Asp-tRNA(Asn)/Glu-tRNA(Gln) amidotransferase A subunit family amidase
MQSKPDAPHHLTASGAASLVAARQLTSEDLVRSCLDQIAMSEPVVRAWSHLDSQRALQAARLCDATAPLSPLHGIPIAVKDVIDAFDMPTGMGSSIYEGYRPRADAACVATLRALGAVILGKTVTAEFAGVSPGPTTNPLAATHTPGGSSSGSAAAVAAKMVPVAFGTQTGGSILRPASFCGIVGFKPSFGTVNRAGLKLAAEGLDTIGLMARDIDDVVLFWSALVGRGFAPIAQRGTPPRLALFRSHHWHRATADTVAAVEGTARRLEAEGAIIEELPLPGGFAELSQARIVINGYERARALAWEWAYHRDQISPMLSRTLEQGWSFSSKDYLAAIRVAERWRSWFTEAMERGRYDCVITAAVNGEAPQGLASTGDASFQEIWTILHVPTITLPLSVGGTGLPVGVQFVGRRLADEALLSLAEWVMQRSVPVPASLG